MPMLLRLGGWSLGAHYSPRRRRLTAAGWGLAACTVAGGGWLARRVRRVEVVGTSMRPTLEPGDRLILVRTHRVRPGQLVALPDPRRPDRTVIKRVAGASGTELTVLGDNPTASTDSRVFGPVSRAAVSGRAVYRYSPPQTAGPLRRRLPKAPRTGLVTST